MLARKVPSVFAPTAGLALLVVLVLTSSPAAAYTCQVTASCCSASLQCQASQGCQCWYTCPPGQQAECHCQCTNGGGGTCGTCQGQICCQGAQVLFENVPLKQALKGLNDTGFRFMAPSLDPESIVTLRAEAGYSSEWMNILAGQLKSVPVYRGELRAVEFVPEGDLRGRTYSRNATSEPFSSGFQDTDAGVAIQRIAAAAQIDLVIPSFLNREKFSGEFPNMKWEDALAAILKESRSQGRVHVNQNGLVEILPW